MSLDMVVDDRIDHGSHATATVIVGRIKDGSRIPSGIRSMAPTILKWLHYVMGPSIMVQTIIWVPVWICPFCVI